MKKAVITGVTGQDGSYLAELLLRKGYEVHGVVRRVSGGNLSRISHLVGREGFFIHNGDITDAGSMFRIISSVQPDEIYNLAAMSHVHASFGVPISTADATGTAFGLILEAVRLINPEIKVYQAGSSEMFGKVQETPQRETTPFYPRSPYGCSKAYAFHLGRVYREAYGLKVYNGILFNHESPRRGEDFLTKKVIKAAAEIKRGERKTVCLGNLDAKRDMGYAEEYVDGMWSMMQQPEADDYVLATGETNAIRDFVSMSFAWFGLNWWEHVVEDKSLFRPAEVDLLVGDASKAKEAFGFDPKVKMKELVGIMAQAEPV